MTKVRHRRIKQISVLRMGFQPRDRMTRKDRARDIRAPGVAAIAAAEQAAVFGPDVDSLAICGGDFDGRDGAAVQMGRNRAPGISVIAGAPDSGGSGKKSV